MESFDLPRIYVQSMSLSQSPILCNASPGQVELFYSLPPHLQEIVFTGAWPDELRKSWQQRCEPNCGLCSTVFNLRTVFLYQSTFDEYAHFRRHGMCTKCKEEHDRRAARRQERLDGIARYRQACADRDEQAMKAHHEWAGVDELYDVCRDWDDYYYRLESSARCAREYRAGLYKGGL